ncbi:unnamed protein product, partial [Strongylus vulgaris]
ESIHDDKYENIGPALFEPIGAESPIVKDTELHLPLEETRTNYMEELYLQSEKKRRRIESRVAEEEKTVEDRRWFKRAQNVLNAIITALRSTNEMQITLNDLLRIGSTRKAAAQKFYILLVLKKLQAINLVQQEPYKDIFISKEPNIAQIMVK